MKIQQILKNKQIKYIKELCTGYAIYNQLMSIRKNMTLH